MALIEDIRERAFHYLADESDDALKKFEDWLVEESWDTHLSDPEAADLAYSLKLLIAEHTSGHRSEVELKRALVPILQQGPWGTASVEPSTGTQPPRPKQVLETVY